jgi:predicted Rossmann-fold nucleotide-binding protein
MLVYGGGRVGLMGVVADEVLRLGCRVIGVIPRALK